MLAPSRRLVPEFKARLEVVRKSALLTVSLIPNSHPFFEPSVQNAVQIHGGKHKREDLTLCGARIRMDHFPVLPFFLFRIPFLKHAASGLAERGQHLAGVET